MSVSTDRNFISTEEFQSEYRRLINAGVAEDAPEFQELLARKHARDEFLYERYGKAHRPGNDGRWIAVSVDGEVIIRDRLGELINEARERFGPGNAALRKLADSSGLRFMTP